VYYFGICACQPVKPPGVTVTNPDKILIFMLFSFIGLSLPTCCCVGTFNNGKMPKVRYRLVADFKKFY
jgi:hypothetical protein